MRLALIEELRNRGCRVTLIVGAKRGALLAMVPTDLPVFELDSHRMLAAVQPLARFLRRARPDVLIASLDHNNITAILAGLLARLSMPVVICQHNALSAESTLGWRYRVVPWLYWLLQRGAHGIVAVSQGVADDLAVASRLPRERIETIYNPVVGPDFDDRAGSGPPHVWLAEPICPVFMFAGRLTEQKDPATLLKAMALLLRRRPARLIVLGEGPLLEDLKALAERLGIAGRVAFVGFQDNSVAWIRHATVLVSSSRYEGLGNVIVESLACGTPVIATDCPHGPSEILMAGKVGRLVPVGDATALADAMAQQLDSSPDKAALKARAAAFAAKACADAHQALFARLLTARPVQALGLCLSPLAAEQVLERVAEEPAKDSVRLVVTPNLDHVRLLRRDDFAAAYRSAELVCPDGFPVLLYARIRGLRLSARVTGCELFQRLASHPRLAEQTLFLVVESTETADAVRSWSERLALASRVQLAVAPKGLAGDISAQAAIAAMIKAAKPTVLVMTLGAPLSEIFVHTHRNALPPCWALCVGQAVRVELGLTARAPSSWRRAGLEWLWRLRQEPRRLIGRYAKAIAWFPMAVLQDLPIIPGKPRG